MRFNKGNRNEYRDKNHITKSDEPTHINPKRKRENTVTEIPRRLKEVCEGCGRQNHTRNVCALKDHPNFNRTGEWVKSEAYKALKNYKDPVTGSERIETELPWSYDIFSKKWGDAPIPKNRGESKKTKPGKEKEESSNQKRYKKIKKTCKYNTCTCMINTLHEDHIDQNHMTKSLIQLNNNILYIDTLLDTGALQDNYIDLDTADWLHSHGLASIIDHKLVCSAFDACKNTNRLFNLHIKIKNYNKIFSYL